MFRVIVQLSCMIVLASVFYDVLSCNRFYKTHTYKSIKYVGTSKYGKMLLKKWKKARRICFKSLGWVSCNTPADNGATTNQVEPCVHLADWSLNLKMNIFSLIHYMLVCFGEKMSSFKNPGYTDHYRISFNRGEQQKHLVKIWPQALQPGMFVQETL